MKYKPLSLFIRVGGCESTLASLVLFFVLWASVAASAISAEVEIDPQPRFYVDANGVTIKCENCEAGESGTLAGSTDETVYTAVDNEMLRVAVANGYDLSKLCTTLATDLSSVFKNTTFFNQDISRWDVSNVTTMQETFMYASAFNQDIGNWDVSSVTDMSRMFMNASKFNQDLNLWDVSSVTNMSDMFGQAPLFNGNISDWDVINVINMNYMFILAKQFNQDLSEWCVYHVTTEPTQFASGSALATANTPVWGTCPGRIIASNIEIADDGAAEFNGSVSPNPVEDNINLYLQGFNNGDLLYSIVDICGRTVVKAKEVVVTNQQGQISTTNVDLKPGIYLLQLYAHDRPVSTTIKFIKK